MFKSAVVLSAALISQTVAADDVGGKIPAGWYEDGLAILRFQKDARRDRGWILTRDGVLVFDYKTRSTTAYVPLPGWTWAGEAFTCPGVAGRVDASRADDVDAVRVGRTRGAGPLLALRAGDCAGAVVVQHAVRGTRISVAEISAALSEAHSRG